MTSSASRWCLWSRGGRKTEQRQYLRYDLRVVEGLYVPAKDMGKGIATLVGEVVSLVCSAIQLRRCWYGT
jgi:hypothetical protein